MANMNQAVCRTALTLAALLASTAALAETQAVTPYADIRYRLELVERHPEGSQAFLCMSADPFLVVVAEDHDGTPGEPVAFVTSGAQGVNIRRNVWHGVLTPLAGPGLFAVVDRIGCMSFMRYFFVTPGGGCGRLAIAAASAASAASRYFSSKNEDV